MSMKAILKFKNEFHAWTWVHERYPDTQWYHDHEASKSAGYEVYRDLDEYYNYICVLGDRLEVNIKEGNQTINLWIEKDNATADTEAEKVYNLPFNDIEAILLKAALSQLCSTFTNLDVVDGKYKNTDASISCLTLVNRIKEVMNEKN